MTILTDGVHLISDKSLDELHAFARGIGLKRSWFQGGKKQRHPHYDLTTRRKARQAIKFGAKEVTVLVLVEASLNAEWRKGEGAGIL